MYTRQFSAQNVDQRILSGRVRSQRVDQASEQPSRRRVWKKLKAQATSRYRFL